MSPEPEEGSTDPLFRGWSPSHRFKALVFLSLGSILVLHPLVGGLPSALGLTGTVQYTAVEVQPERDALSFSGPDRAAHRAEGAIGGQSGLQIDCYPIGVSDRCALESQLTAGNLTVPTGPDNWRGYSYHGEFYKQVSTENQENTTLALQPVPARAVLANLSVSTRHWSAPLTTAVETGNVTVRSELQHAERLLARNGSYYVVVPMSDRSRDTSPGGLSATISTVLGVLSFQRGIHHYSH